MNYFQIHIYFLIHFSLVEICYSVNCLSYPMPCCQSKSRSFLHVTFEELVSKMLCKESKHQAGSLWICDELSSHQELFSQNLGIRKLFLTWGNHKGHYGCDSQFQ